MAYTGEAVRGFDLVPDGVARYAGLVDVDVTLDTAAAGWWAGGSFFAVAENGHGSGFVVERGGVPLVTSDIVASAHNELSQWGYTQSLADGRMSIQIGRQDVNQMFCVNGPGSSFVQPSFTLIPTVPMPTFPAPALGVALAAEPDPAFALRGGFFDGGGRISSFGVDTFFDNAGGYFSVLEPAWTPAWGTDGGLPASYRVGLWYHSGSFPALAGADARRFDGNYGAYLLAAQVVREADPGGAGKLAVFLQVGWSPADRNRAGRYVGAGLSWTGALPSRPHDVLGLGLNRTSLASRTTPGDKVALASIELFYQIAFTPWLGVQPDIQYYGGAGHGAEGSVAAGLRWLVHL